MIRAGAVLASVLAPAAAEACASCIASPFGDQSYTWPYLALIILPFLLATVIGTVLARAAGVTMRGLSRRITAWFHPSARQEETT